MTLSFRFALLRCSLALTAFTALVCAMAGTAEAGLTINATFDTGSFGSQNVANVESAFNYAASEFQTLFTNNITVNITVQGVNGGLGSSSTNLQGYFTYAQVRQALVNNELAHPSVVGAEAVASLPLNNPTTGQFAMANAEAKALGFLSANALGTDGTFSFNRNTTFTFDPNNRGSGGFDFIGVAEHEISEILGRIPGLGTNFGDGGPDYLPNDLFRYTSAGVRSINQIDNNVYLSVDGGVTKLAGFNGPGGGDLDDYDGAVPTDPFNASTGSNQAHALTQADIANLQALGYNIVNNQGLATPEPATMMAAGLGVVAALAFTRRRRATA